MSWLIDNIGTVIALLILAIVIALIIIKMVKDKKNGKTGCSCGCDHCAMKDNCHKR